jgi:hypothetical protein
MPAFSCLLMSRRSPTLWHRVVPIHTVFFIVHGHSPLHRCIGSGAFYFYHRQRDPPGILHLSLDPRPGTTARTAPILGILEIVGRYMYRYNFCPRVVIPLQQGSSHRHASSLPLYVYYNFGTSLSPRTNPYPYSEPAIRKITLYCLAHHYCTTLYDGVSIRLLRRLVHGYQIAVCFILEHLHRGLQGSPLQATRS